MAEENGDADDGEGKKGGKLKLIIIAVAGLLILGGGGGAAAYFLGLFGGADETGAHADEGDGHGEQAADAHGEDPPGDGHGEETADAHAADAHGGGAEGEGEGVVFVDMPDVLVNLQTAGSRMRFLKMRV
ncbi:MAG: hypothetical protein KDH19_17930, partial [Geminicoccaceae bacterium]|nr:hypothetical protein [Geminicoccaceae bacterium]